MNKQKVKWTHTFHLFLGNWFCSHSSSSGKRKHHIKQRTPPGTYYNLFKPPVLINKCCASPFLIIVHHRGAKPSCSSAVISHMNIFCLHQVTGRSSGTVIPPPLVRGGQHVPSKHNSQIVMPPLVRGAQVSMSPHCLTFRVHPIEMLCQFINFSLFSCAPTLCPQPIAVTPQQIASLRQQQQQHSGSGPPPLLLAPRASVPNVQVQGQRIIQQGLIRVANVANSNVMVNIPQVRHDVMIIMNYYNQIQETCSVIFPYRSYT